MSAPEYTTVRCACGRASMSVPGHMEVLNLRCPWCPPAKPTTASEPHLKLVDDGEALVGDGE